MKDFESLTDAEVCALTDEQRAFYRDFACAEAGAPIALVEPKPPTKPDVGNDLVVHTVGGFHFAAAEDAAKVAELVNSFTRYETKWVPGGYLRQYAHVDTDPVTPTVQHMLTQAAAQANAAKIADHDREKKQFEADKTKYDQGVRARQNATASIDARIAEAYSNERQRANLRLAHTRYIELAEGNERVAARFLLRSNPEARELTPELVSMADAAEVLPGPAPAPAEDASDDIQF